MKRGNKLVSEEVLIDEKERLLENIKGKISGQNDTDKRIEELEFRNTRDE